MFVIRLPNGNLKVPRTAVGDGGRLIGQVYVEIGPGDAEYERLARQAMTEEEMEERRNRWRREDDALYREFLAFAHAAAWAKARILDEARRRRSGARHHRARWPSAAGSMSPRSSARTSDSRNRRCPPGVRMLLI